MGGNVRKLIWIGITAYARNVLRCYLLRGYSAAYIYNANRANSRERRRSGFVPQRFNLRSKWRIKVARVRRSTLLTSQLHPLTIKRQKSRELSRLSSSPKVYLGTDNDSINYQFEGKCVKLNPGQLFAAQDQDTMPGTQTNKQFYIFPHVLE